MEEEKKRGINSEKLAKEIAKHIRHQNEHVLSDLNSQRDRAITFKDTREDTAGQKEQSLIVSEIPGEEIKEEVKEESSVHL